MPKVSKRSFIGSILSALLGSASASTARAGSSKMAGDAAGATSLPDGSASMLPATHVTNRRGGTAALRSIADEIEAGFVCPDQFKADHETDDDAATHRAVEFARRNGHGLQFTGMRSYHLGPQNFADLRSIAGHSSFATKLVALSGSVPRESVGKSSFITFKNMARASIQNICIDANGVFGTALDTSYDTLGPSLNLLFKNIAITGFTELGWLADNNNDVWNENIVVLEPAKGAISPSAYRNIGSGGPVHFSGCNFLAGPITVSSQWTNMVNTVVTGMIVPAGSGGWNVINSSGGHFFPDASTKLNFQFDGEIWGFTLHGAHVENGIDGGAIFGGRGKLLTNILLLQGCHVFNSTAQRTPPVLARTGMQVFGDDRATIRFLGGAVTGIAPDSPWAEIEAPGCAWLGSMNHPFQHLGVRSPAGYTHLTPLGLEARSGHGSRLTGMITLSPAVTLIANVWSELAALPTASGSIFIALIGSETVGAPACCRVISIAPEGASMTSLTEVAATGAFAGAKLEMRLEGGKWMIRLAGKNGRTAIYSAQITGLKN